MKPKQLIILGVVLVALIFLYSFSGNDENTGSKSGLQAGDVIINSETLNVNDVTSLKISDTDDSVHLSRQQGSWVVSNRDNYKADFSKISKNQVLGRFKSNSLRFAHPPRPAQGPRDLVYAGRS